MDHFTTVVALIGAVIVIASLLASTLERTGMPLAAVFLALGALLGPLGLGLLDIGIDSPALRVLATLGLALVLFSDAVTIELSDIRKHFRLLLRLLGPGTLAPAALTALAGWQLLGLSPLAAILLGAALASTDAILLRRVLADKVLPPTAQMALRLETGMNDILLLPIVLLAIAIMRTAGDMGGAVLARSAVAVLLLGPVVGAVVGWGGVKALIAARRKGGMRRDYEALYALALAFIAFAAAEALGGSGFVAAFAAGVTIGAQDVELCDCFHEYGEATSLMLLLLTFVAFGVSLIWTGLDVIDARTMLFAVIAVTVRTVVVWPLLAGVVPPRERRLIALLGPRGISSLLLSLLPVFAGISGAGRLFQLTCLVVLLSIVVHGAGMAVLLRGSAAAKPPRATPLPVVEAAADIVKPAEKISVAELKALWSAGEKVVIADARTERSLRQGEGRAAGSVRLPPDDPLAAAEALRVPKDANVLVFCT